MKRAESLSESFGYAFQGLWYALNTQRNLRVHLLAAVAILVLGWFVNLSEPKFVSVLIAVVVVMMAEMINTAVESVVDLVSPEFHQLAKTAKDVAAGAVLLAAMGAAAVGLWAFGPIVGQLPGRLMLRFDHEPLVAVILLAVVGVVSGFVLWISGRRVRFPGGRSR